METRHRFRTLAIIWLALLVAGPASRSYGQNPATAPYNVLLLTLAQYNAFVATNGTGFNGSILHGAPSTYFWSTGATTSTNETLLMGNGTWYLLLYNPGSVEITVDLGSESCNAP